MYPDNTESLQINTTSSHTQPAYNQRTRSQSPTQPLTPSSSISSDMSIQQHTGYSSTEDDISMSDTDTEQHTNPRQCRKRRSQSHSEQSHKRIHTQQATQQQPSTTVLNQSAVLNNTTHTNTTNTTRSPFMTLQTDNKQCNKLVRWLTLLGNKRVKQLLFLLSTVFLVFWSYNTHTIIQHTLQQTTVQPTLQARTYASQRITMFNYTTVTRMMMPIQHLQYTHNNNNVIGMQQSRPVQHTQYQHHTFIHRQPLQLTANIQQPHTNIIRRIIHTVGTMKWWSVIAGIVTVAVCFVTTR